MDFIAQYIHEDIIYALGWTVIHSLWQGMVLALIMALAMVGLQKKSARVRYELASFTLFSTLIIAVCTFTYMYDVASTLPASASFMDIAFGLSGTAAGEAGFIGELLHQMNAYFNQHLPLIVSVWMMGMAFFLLRLLGGFAYIQRLRHQKNQPLNEYWQRQLRQLKFVMKMDKKVALLESALVKVPMVIGYFKPAILMPMGAINNLSHQEVEAVLAHELAHIRRNDYLLNILLSFIEVLFYYNPAVWFISANIRSERENCCDDLAIRLCGNSLTYAKALVRLQELNQAAIPVFAMPLFSNKKQLLNRISRILNQPQNRNRIREKLAATTLLLCSILFISMSANSAYDAVEDTAGKTITIQSNFDQDNLSLQLVTDGDIELIAALDTLPPKKKKRLQLTKETNDERVELMMEDGEIKQLNIDGKEIPASEFEDYSEITNALLEEAQNVPPPPPVPTFGDIPAPPPPPSFPGDLLVPAPPPAPPTPNGMTPPAPPAAPRAISPAPPPAPPAPPSPPSPPSVEEFKHSYRFNIGEDGTENTIIVLRETDNAAQQEVKIFIEGKEKNKKKSKNKKKRKLKRKLKKLSSDGHSFIFADSIFFSDQSRFLKHDAENNSYRYYNLAESPLSKELPLNLALSGEALRPLTDWVFKDEDTKQFFSLQEGRDTLSPEELQVRSQQLLQQIRERQAERLEEVAEVYAQQSLRQEENREKLEQVMEEAAIRHKETLALRNELYTERQEEFEQLRDKMQHIREFDYLNRLQSQSRKKSSYDQLESSFENNLINDGLIQKGDDYSIQLTEEELKINGNKQSESMRQKYIQLYRQATGENVNGKLEIKRSN